MRHRNKKKMVLSRRSEMVGWRGASCCALSGGRLRVRWRRGEGPSLRGLEPSIDGAVLAIVQPSPSSSTATLAHNETGKAPQNSVGFTDILPRSSYKNRWKVYSWAFSCGAGCHLKPLARQFLCSTETDRPLWKGTDEVGHTRITYPEQWGRTAL